MRDIELKIQVLISTMNQIDYSLLDRMNIQTDAIVINQSNFDKIERFCYNGHQIVWISINERGIGLSRNTALMRATADIVYFADDDLVFEDDFVEKVNNAFLKHNKADLIVFNIESMNSARPEYQDTSDHRLRWFNYLKYGACRIAVKRNKLLRSGVTFSLLFGGGAIYQAGEDNLFIKKCMSSMNCWASKTFVGSVKQEESSWFKGYNVKYYLDRGALFYNMYGKWAFIFILLIELKNIKRKSELNLIKRLKCEFKGIRDFSL